MFFSLSNGLCVTCGKHFKTEKELQDHMKENSHYSPLPFFEKKEDWEEEHQKKDDEWQNEKFLVPVLEEDPLLLSLFDELVKDEDSLS